MKNSFDTNGSGSNAKKNSAPEPQNHARRSFAPFWILLGLGLSLGSAVVLLYIAQKSVNEHRSQKLSGDVPTSKTLATRLELKFSPEKMMARENNLWSLKIVDAKEIDQRASTPDNPKNKYIRSFVWDGDNLINLMIASHDGSYFARLNPEYKDYGHFLLNVAVPRPGKYTLIADYLPHNKDKREIVLHDFEVGGTKYAANDIRSNAIDNTLKGIAPDTNPEGNWDLIGPATLDIDGKPIGTAPIFPQGPGDILWIRLKDRNIRAGQNETLTFELRDKDETPITDLELYQGVAARCAIISDDFKTYVHATPEAKQLNNGRGPQIAFKANFPHAGKYTLWAQFQHRGNVVTQPIEIEVK